VSSGDRIFLVDSDEGAVGDPEWARIMTDDTPATLATEVIEGLTIPRNLRPGPTPSPEALGNFGELPDRE
jgi:hypothetical protein